MSAKIVRQCETCGKEVSRRPSQVKNPERCYCSILCRNTRDNSIPTLDRIMRLVDKTGECWIWTGAHYDSGYGACSIRGVPSKRVHRAVWILTHGPIGPNELVCHKCDNRSCCNPDHLFIGTHADNMADMTSKLRHAFGSKSPLTHLDESDVVSIRSSSEPLSVLANRYGVQKACISKIRLRRSWNYT